MNRFHGRWHGDTVTVTIGTPGGPATIDGHAHSYSVRIGISNDLGRFPTLDQAIEAIECVIRIGPGMVEWLVVSNDRATVYGRGMTIDAANERAKAAHGTLSDTTLITAYIGAGTGTTGEFFEIFDPAVVRIPA